nr:reverse transcriptase domain-containing protein [Tanacetum cinerariifolium]
MRFQQRFDESFSEAWDHFNDLLRACPHHGFYELHQLDAFYNALNVNDQDSLNSAAGGNFLDKMPSDCLKIIESKSKVRQSRAKAVVAKKNQSSAQVTSSTPAPIKAVESNCVTCGGTHSYQNCPATSGNVYQDNINDPTPSDDQIISTTSPTLTPFGDSDFLLFEEANAFLAILNSDLVPSLPNHEQSVPSFINELKACEAQTIKYSIDKPPEVELKDLPPHLEYAFLEGDNKLPVIIGKELGEEEKAALIKILMEEDYKLAVQHQRRVNPKIHDVIKKEVEKLLDVVLIYPISDSLWVSPVHCVPKKGGFTIVKNEESELIPTRLVTGWR